MTEKTKGIVVVIRFWTDFGKDKNGKTIYHKKKAYAAGTLTLKTSSFHELETDKVFFNNLEELQIKLDGLLRRNNISLVIKDKDGNLSPRLGKDYPKSTWSGYK